MSTTKIIIKQIPRLGSTNSRFVLAMFWITMLFQLTILKHIWAIEGLSRFVNLAALLALCLFAVHSMISHRFDKNVWQFYLLPGLFVFIGMFLNITLNTISNLNIINYFGMMLPWAIYLAMPTLLEKKSCDIDTLWHYFYYFMLTAVILGLLDYFLFFSDASSLGIIWTPYGAYLAGRFSVLYMLTDGSIQNRFYACFAEPGTLAMFLLPAIAYAYSHKKYIGLIVLIAGLYLTYSFGGMYGFVMLISLLLFISFNKGKTPRVISVVVFIFASSVIVIYNWDNIITSYENRKESGDYRERDFKYTISNLPSIITNNPIGFKLAEGALSASQSDDYYGSTFTPGNALQLGGIIAFLGYLVVLLVSLMVAFLLITRKNLSLEEKVVVPSLIVLFPYIFQRATVWDSAIFAFLFAPTIIRFLQSRGGSSSYAIKSTTRLPARVVPQISEQIR